MGVWRPGAHFSVAHEEECATARIAAFVEVRGDAATDERADEDELGAD